MQKASNNQNQELLNTKIYIINICPTEKEPMAQLHPEKTIKKNNILQKKFATVQQLYKV